MAELFRIEIPVEVQLGSDLDQATQKLMILVEAMRRSREEMEQMNRTKLQLIGSGINKTMDKLNMVRRTLRSIAGRTWRIGFSVASASLGLLGSLLGRMSGMMEKTTDQWSKFRDNLKVNFVQRWATGLDTALFPVMAEMNQWFDDNKEMIARWGDQLQNAGRIIGTWVVGKVKGEKIDINWDFLSQTFSDWWSSHQKSVLQIFEDAGGFLGDALKGGIMAALGILSPSDKLDKDQSPFVTAGAQAGKSFFDEFMKQLDVDAIGKKLWQAVMPSMDKSLGRNVGGIILGSALLSGGLALGEKIFGRPAKLVKKTWDLGKKVFGKGTPKAAPKAIETAAKDLSSLGPRTTKLGIFDKMLRSGEKIVRKVMPKTKTLGKFGKVLGPLGTLTTIFSAIELGDQFIDYIFGHSAGLPKPGFNPFHHTLWEDTRLPIWKRLFNDDNESVPVSAAKSQTVTIQVNTSPSYQLNIATNADEVTKIMQEHTVEYGNTIADLIAEKLSIINANSP